MISYHIWDAIASTPTLLKDVGVQMRPADFFFPVLIEEDASQLSKMQEIEASGVKGFRRDPHIIYERGVNPAYGAIDAYEHLSPIIDTDQAMAWLMRLIKTKGAILHTRTVHGDLIHQETSLLKEFSASIMINATGLSSAETASDTTCYPLRGGILRVLNNGIDFPKIEAALTISADAAQDNEIVFIVPRNDDILLIGGIAEEREETIELGVESEKVRRMRGRCEVFLPVLREARLDPGYPFAQGLRPARRSNVRVERDVRSNGEGGGQSRIIHSYGHGGSGWTLSFGCAGDVATLVEEALLGAPLRSKMWLVMYMRLIAIREMKTTCLRIIGNREKQRLGVPTIP